MKSRILNYVLETTLAIVCTTAILSSPALGQNLPAHSSTAACYGPFYDRSFAIGAGPTDFQLMPGATTFQTRAAAVDGSGNVTAGSVGAVPAGVWLYFQAVVGWRAGDGKWYQRSGQWLASFNGFYERGVYRLQNGVWVLLQPGGFEVSGHIIASQVPLPGRGTYWYGANYYWGGVPNTAFTGYNRFEWVGTVTC